MIAKFIPEENAQRTDPEWNFDGVQIGPNSQCQGNCNQDLVKAAAMEFGIVELREIDTYTYYNIFYLHFKKLKGRSPNRGEFMNWRNHGAVLNSIFESAKIPLEAVCSEIKSTKEIVDALKRTERIMSLGTLLSPSGHWIRINGYNNGVFRANDPFGMHPYRSNWEKIQVTAKYGEQYLSRYTTRRLITLEDKK